MRNKATFTGTIEVPPLRAVFQREGNRTTAFGRIQTLGRMHIVVQ